MEWSIKTFEELTTRELYAILKARCEVFVMEQNCPYLDPDGLDLISLHIFTMEQDTVAAYCRVTPKGSRFPTLSIGRVITTASYRGTGLGRELMRRAVEHITHTLGETEITISAQQHLHDFYRSFGFRQSSQTYLEDNIPHIEMQWEVAPIPVL